MTGPPGLPGEPGPPRRIAAAATGLAWWAWLVAVACLVSYGLNRWLVGLAV